MQVGGRPPPVPAGGVRARRPVGARQVRARSASPTPTWRRPPTAARPSSAPAPGADPDAPTVLLYAHYDVQPPLDEDAWRTPPFELTEVDGRWYGRGAADCKGNIVMHLAALRALGDDLPVNLKLVVEGSEEQGTGGLEDFVPEHADLLRADAILVCDTGNAAVGVPAATVSLRGMVNVVVTVEALAAELHSGMFGGAAPDALAALVAMLATLRDERGQHHDQRARQQPDVDGRAVPARAVPRGRRRRRRAPRSLGGGTVSDMLWARPALTILGIDCPPVVGSAAAIAPRAAARLNLRIPPGIDPGARRATALVEHLRAAAPWGVQVTVETEATGAPFRAATDGPAYQAIGDAMQEAYGRPMAPLGQGGSIPLCNVFADTYPDAEIILMGVEEPQCPDPRTQRERGPERDREDGARRGPVPAGLREPTLTAVPRVNDRSRRTPSLGTACRPSTVGYTPTRSHR